MSIPVLMSMLVLLLLPVVTIIVSVRLCLDQHFQIPIYRRVWVGVIVVPHACRYPYPDSCFYSLSEWGVFFFLVGMGMSMGMGDSDSELPCACAYPYSEGIIVVVVIFRLGVGGRVVCGSGVDQSLECLGVRGVGVWVVVVVVLMVDGWGRGVRERVVMEMVVVMVVEAGVELRAGVGRVAR